MSILPGLKIENKCIILTKTHVCSNDTKMLLFWPCVKDDAGNLSFDNEAKKVAWKQHYERILNEEFSWNPEDLTADPVIGPPIHIDVEMVVKAITKMNWQSCWSLGNSSRNAEGIW